MRTSRQEWARRVQRWLSSGQSAEDFAAQMNINARTLENWKYKLGVARGGTQEPSSQGVHPAEESAPDPERLPLIEVRPTTVSPDERFEIELGCGRRLHVAPTFEAKALRRLLAVLEER